ncbi:hypothetical protein [Rhodanobacter sp. A1T4]|jgi:hypothetical protein|uniref:hypothetical protein n=1 Tax=Rhodanobacter sp. A1T4 TaxID=2723087 RepID=UPI001621F9A3|nr:hypothetical protein [Rhodanobacter sp. A1T4]MBB6245624.1 hypothetical protein [Rhodanobacter sp. A1T4]
MYVMPRLTLASVIAVLLIAGCAHQPPAKTTTVTATRTTSAPTASSTTTSTRTAHRASASGTATQSAANLPDHTGIAACDDYLSSYMACHRAANIFAPSQLQSRYDAMRTSLLRDSQDPDIRPQLAARCNSLASLLRDALHGKSCDANPAPASTTP